MNGDSDANTPLWTDRDIVLEYFPNTHEHLVPKPLRFQLQDVGDGRADVLTRAGVRLGQLTPVEPHGNPTGELCCDLCQRTGTRRFLGLFRFATQDGSKQRLRYITACRDRDACEDRRIDDGSLDRLLRGLI